MDKEKASEKQMDGEKEKADEKQMRGEEEGRRRVLTPEPNPALIWLVTRTGRGRATQPSPHGAHRNSRNSLPPSRP